MTSILAILAAVRIVVLYLFDSEAESFFLNALLLQFGLPFVGAFALAWLASSDVGQRLRRVYQVAAMLLGFVWASFLVQDYFGGVRLLSGVSSSTELYVYSVVWLVLAVVYQAIGLWRDQRVILLLAKIGKVFLVDASELEGLYRVLSFLGFGIALIGIGFFYNKVVFTRERGLEVME